MTLYLGHTYQQKLLTSSGKTISNSKIKWTTNNKAVATVSSTGKITAKKVGTAKITAKYNGKSYKCTVNAKNSVTVSPSTINIDMSVNKTASISVRYKEYATITYDIYQGYGVVNASWSNQWDGDYITLNLEAKKEGVAKIKVYSKLYPKNYKIITVNVKNPMPKVVCKQQFPLRVMDGMTEIRIDSVDGILSDFSDDEYKVNLDFTGTVIGTTERNHPIILGYTIYDSEGYNVYTSDIIFSYTKIGEKIKKTNLFFVPKSYVKGDYTIEFILYNK